MNIFGFTKGVQRSEFTRNIVVLLTGTTVSQLIPILSAFVLTRIYSPSDYGVLGVFLTIVAVAGSVATLQYNNVIIVSENEEEAADALALVVSLTTLVSVLCLLVVVVFNSLICDFFNKPELSLWLYFVPVSVFLTGWGLGFTGWMNRTKMYKQMSFTRIIAAVLLSVISIAVGFIMNGPLGLFLGQVVSQLVVALYLWYQYFVKEGRRLKIRWAEVKYTAYKYSNFPKYTFPADFIFQVINQLPVMMITRYSANLVAVGLFNFSNRILGLPSMVFATAVSEVFKQRAVNDYFEKGSCRMIFMKVLKSLTLTALLPFLILLVFGPDLFEFCFGPKWRGAGEYAQILSVMIFFRFIASPLSFVFTIARKQKMDFILHLLILSSISLVFFTGFYYNLDIKKILLIYSFVYSFIYIIYLVLSYKYTVRYE